MRGTKDKMPSLQPLPGLTDDEDVLFWGVALFSDDLDAADVLGDYLNSSLGLTDRYLCLALLLTAAAVFHCA